MSGGREQNGRFAIGNRANPTGRPRKGRSVNDTILREMKAPVMITENNKRRRITKLEATAKQLANQGASGDFRAAKLTVDLALRAEGSKDTSPAPLPLTENDRAIAERFIARLGLTQLQVEGNTNDDPA